MAKKRTKTEFKIGDRVRHPNMPGPLVIEEINTDLFDDMQVFYVMNISTGNRFSAGPANLTHDILGQLAAEAPE